MSICLFLLIPVRSCGDCGNIVDGPISQTSGLQAVHRHDCMLHLLLTGTIVNYTGKDVLPHRCFYPDVANLKKGDNPPFQI